MLPLNSTYRRMLLKHIPQLTSEDLDRYENLMALHTQLKFEQGMYPKKRTSKDDLVKKSYEKALEILAPVTKQYNKVNLQWKVRRDFASAQSDYPQIPYTFTGVAKFTWLGIKFYGINIYTTLYLWIYKLISYYIQKNNIYKIIAIIIFFILIILGLRALIPIG